MSRDLKSLSEIRNCQTPEARQEGSLSSDRIGRLGKTGSRLGQKEAGGRNFNIAR